MTTAREPGSPAVQPPRAEEAPLPEPEPYRALVAQVPVGIWTSDAAGRTTFVNAHGARLVGRREQELLGTALTDHVHPDDLAVARATWATAVRAGAAWEHDHRLLTPDATVRHVLSSARPLHDVDGAVTGFVGTILDLTAERRAERSRRATATEQAARRVSEAASARLQAMVQGLAAIVWEADWDAAQRELVFTFVSDRAEELLGHPVQRWRERPGLWPTVIHPDDRAEVLAVTAERTAAGLDHDLTYRAVSAGGRTVWLHQVVHVVPGADGAPVRAQGLTVDVTQQRRAERSAAVLAETGRLVTDTGTTEQRLAALARSVVHDLGDGVVVSLVGPDGLARRIAVAHDDPAVERALIGLAPTRLPPSLAAAIRPGRPIVVPVTDELSRAAARDDDDAAARIELGATSSLVVPLLVGGELAGLLGFVNFGPRQYDDIDLDLAEELGRRVSLMLGTDRQRLRDQHMQQMSAELAAAGTVAEAAQRLTRRLTAALGAGAMSVYLVEPDRGIRLVHGEGYSAAMLDAFTLIRFDEPIPLSQVVRTGEPVWVHSREDWRQRWPDLLPHVVAHDRHAAATLPLLVGGRVVGTIGISFATERTFPADERAFVMALVTQAASAFERAATADERRMIAETLQSSLLPAALPRLERLVLAACYLPGAQGTRAGGDWYDVLPLDDGRIAVVVGDVVGQGARAAAIMGQLRSALSGYLIEGHGPRPALELLDRFAARVPGAAGSTVACLVVTPATGEIEWASAGHLPPLVTGPGGARYLEGPGGTVLVVRDRAPFVANRALIAPGDSIVLYTDGLVERRGEVVDDGLDRLAAGAARHHGLAPRALTDALLAGAGLTGAEQDAAGRGATGRGATGRGATGRGATGRGATGRGAAGRGRTGSAGAADDVALIVARFVPATLRLELPARPAELRTLRTAVAAWALGVALGADDAYDLQLAVGEAVANAMEHAYRDQPAGPVSVELARTAGGAVRALVRDRGRWHPPPQDRGHRGRGLDLIRDVSATMELLPGPDGTQVSFVLPAPPSAAAPPLPPAPVGSPGPAALRIDAGTGAPCVAVLGDLDLAGVRAVRTELLATVRGAADHEVVVVDVRAAAYLASAGVALLVEAQQAAPGGRLRVVVRPGGIARRALALSGVDSVLDVVEEPDGG